MNVFGLRGNRGVSRRFGDLFTLSTWGARKPWRPCDPRSGGATPADGTSPTQLGRASARRRGRAA